MRIKLLLVLASAWSLSAADPVWRPALPGYGYEFPRDHFDHPEFRTEWWYYTGNARAGDGRRFGFELVFFRQGHRRGPSENASAWRVDDLYLAHAALTDITARKFHYHKRLSRAGPGMAGADFAARRIWNGNWEAQWDDAGGQTIRAIAEGMKFELRLLPLKAPVVHGENGVSAKAAGEGRASHYVSFTRLEVTGKVNGAPVTGTAWMDHEWFTHQLDATQVGWDWFSVQLENGTELMLFQLRRQDGSIDEHSSGTFVDASGRARHLRHGDFRLEPLEYWASPKTKARYPVRWRVTAPSVGVSLECAAVLKEQELVSEKRAGPTYWEGAVSYTGNTVGVGYLEMTGYAGAVRLE